MRIARLFTVLFMIFAIIGALDAGLDPARAQEPGGPSPHWPNPADYDYRVYSPILTVQASRDKPVKRQAEEVQAADAAQAGCDVGDLAACIALGEAYELGAGREQVRPVAAVLYTQACDGGFGDGCTRLGMLARIGMDEANATDARALFDRACRLGSLEGCAQSAVAIASDPVDPAGPGRAVALLRDFCAKGEGSACRELGSLLLLNARSGADTGEALRLLDGECKADDVEACEALLNIDPDAPAHPDQPPRAQTLRNACNAARHYGAWWCDEVGEMAFAGKGVPRNLEFAQAAFDKACALSTANCDKASALRATPALDQRCREGVQAACVTLALNNLYGLPSFIDYGRAIQLLQNACLTGQAQACEPAANSVRTSFVEPEAGDASSAMPIDVTRFQLLERGCDLRDRMACYSLAQELENGEATVLDQPRANAIYVDLCNQDWASACRRIDEIALDDPHVPIPTAGSRFTPPVDEETRLPDQEPSADAEPVRACTPVTVIFRGKSFTDFLCPRQAPRMINGDRVSPSDAPWQALLWRPERIGNKQLRPADRVLCGGALIEQGWILTAAHCLNDEGRELRTFPGYRVRLGVSNPREDEGTSYPILEVFEHPFYSLRGYVFDIALVRYDASRPIRADKAYPFRKIALDPLSVSERTISDGMTAYAYGWGWTEANNSTSSDQLLSGKLALQDLDTCTRLTKLQGALLHAQLCAVGVNGQQACDGDSGGPLIYYSDGDKRPKVIGVVSAGPKAADRKCGGKGDPSRYTRVGRARDWIDRTMRANR